MTKDEALAALRASLAETKDACCIHQGEGGTYHAPGCEDDIATLEDIIDAVEGLHTTEFVAEWLTAIDLWSVVQMWRAEMEGGEELRRSADEG